MNLDKIGKWIVAGVFLVAIPRYIVAFTAVEPDFVAFGFHLPVSAITGTGTAILLEGGLWFTTTRMIETMRKGYRVNAFGVSIPLWSVLLFFVVVQMMLAPVLVVPVLYLHMDGALREQLGRHAKTWTWFIASAPVLLVAGATIADVAMALRTSTTKQKKSDGEDTERNETPTEEKRKVYKVCPLCDVVTYSQQGWAGHCGSKDHKKRKAEQESV